MLTLVNPQLLSTGVTWEYDKSQSLSTQFSDDAVVVGDDQKTTQLVIFITFFQRWAAWADLLIRPDKSFAYGASQRNGRYQQILPNFHLNSLPIRPIAMGENMTYLGRCFSFSSDGEKRRNSSSLASRICYHSQTVYQSLFN